MKKTPYIFYLLFVTSALTVFGFFPEAYCRQHPWEGSYVSYLHGTAYGRADSDEEFGVLERNMPLQEGDELLTRENTFMEIALSNGVMVWFNSGTILKLDKIYNKPVVDFELGEFFLHNPGESRSNTTVTIGYESSRSVYIYPDSLAKLSLGEDGEFSLEVWKGKAQIAIDSGIISVEKGKRLSVRADGTSLYFSSFSLSPRENFEKLALAHYKQIDKHDTTQYVKEPINGISRLHDYGDWYYDAHVSSYVWRPRVGGYWRPFLYGRWIYHPYGAYWVSYDRWGWGPYHYGRWFRDGLGRWVWVPGYHFSPARVLFYSYGSYYFWAPMGFGIYYYSYPYVKECDYYVFVDKDCFYAECKKNDHSDDTLYHRLTENDFDGKDIKSLIAKPLKEIPRVGDGIRFRPKKHEIPKKIINRVARFKQRRSPVWSAKSALPERISAGRVSVQQPLRRDTDRILRQKPLRKLSQTAGKYRKSRRGSFTVINSPKLRDSRKSRFAFSDRRPQTVKTPARNFLKEKVLNRSSYATQRRERLQKPLTTGTALTRKSLQSSSQRPGSRFVNRKTSGRTSARRSLKTGRVANALTTAAPLSRLKVKSFSFNR